jgi:hypothetical protein
MRKGMIFLVLGALFLVPSLTEARLTQLVITRTESPTFEGSSFGSVGQYERLVGYAKGELDPKDPLNKVIVNIDKAPRNGHDLVEYQMDVYILKPVDLKKGNGRIFYDVLNRGGKLINSYFNNAPSSAGNNPHLAADAGNGFLMKEGYTLLWSGWQCTYPISGSAGDGSRISIPSGNSSGLMVAQFPVAKNSDGTSIVAYSREEFIPDTSYAPTATSYVVNLTYPAANPDPTKATLTVREHQTDPRQTPSGVSWKYLPAESDGNVWRIQITRPTDTVAFDNGAIYEFIYQAKDPLVTGMAFASLRDLVSFLRHGVKDDLNNPNPLAHLGKPTIEKAIGFGSSQSGRYIKNFVYEGFNEDENHRKIFDGIMTHVGGSRLNWLNFEFSQTGRWSRQHEEHYQVNDQFPFTYRTLHDHISGKTDGFLVKCRKQDRDEHEGTCPKIMQTDTDCEMWQARASLVVTDTKGHDIELPENVRYYHVASAQHSAAVTPPARPAICQQLNNPLDYRPLFRSLLVAMDRWITYGIKPPHSRHSQRHNGTLVHSDQASTGFPNIPGVTYNGVYSILRLTDYSVQPPHEGPLYPVYVPKVDPDGNAIAGIRLPDIEVPIGTYTGWNHRIKGYAENDLCTGTTGSYIPFVKTPADRNGDPRLSIQERYKDHSDYVRKVTHAAYDLVRERFLLWEDAKAIIDAAEASDIGK